MFWFCCCDRCEPRMKEIEVEDWDTGSMVKIKLDPNKSAVELSKNLYKKASKQRRTQAVVTPLLEKAEQEVTFLTEVQESVEELRVFEEYADLQALKEIKVLCGQKSPSCSLFLELGFLLICNKNHQNQWQWQQRSSVNRFAEIRGLSQGLVAVVFLSSLIAVGPCFVCSAHWSQYSGVEHDCLSGQSPCWVHGPIQIVVLTCLDCSCHELLLHLLKALLHLINALLVGSRCIGTGDIWSSTTSTLTTNGPHGTQPLQIVLMLCNNMPVNLFIGHTPKSGHGFFWFYIMDPMEDVIP